MFSVDRRFVLTFGLRFSGGHTLAQIPYDALGMELSPDYDQRSRLFGFKTMSGFAGALLAAVCSILFAFVFSSSISLQAQALAAMSTVLLLASALFLLSSVEESPRKSKPGGGSSFVTTMIDLARNGPYMNYVMIKFCITLGSQLVRMGRNRALDAQGPATCEQRERAANGSERTKCAPRKRSHLPSLSTTQSMHCSLRTLHFSWASSKWGC